MFGHLSRGEAAHYSCGCLPLRRIGAHPPMKRIDGLLASVTARIRPLGASSKSPHPGTSGAAVSSGSVGPRRGGAVGVVVQPSAREAFAPDELSAAYKDFIRGDPQYLDAESGIGASAYRFGTRVLVVYQEHETGVTILVHPTFQKGGLPS